MVRWYRSMLRETPSVVKYGSVVLSTKVRLSLLVLTSMPTELPEPKALSCLKPKLRPKPSALE